MISLIEDPQKESPIVLCCVAKTGKGVFIMASVMEAHCNNPADTVTAARDMLRGSFKEAYQHRHLNINSFDSCCTVEQYGFHTGKPPKS